MLAVMGMSGLRSSVHQRKKVLSVVKVMNIVNSCIVYFKILDILNKFL